MNLLITIENCVRKMQGRLSVENQQANVDAVYYSQQEQIKYLRKLLGRYIKVPELGKVEELRNLAEQES